MAIFAPDDPQSFNQSAGRTGKPGHNGRAGRPSGARRPDDPRSQRSTARENPPAGRARRATDRPRDRDTPATRNLKTDGPYLVGSLVCLWDALWRRENPVSAGRRWLGRVLVAGGCGVVRAAGGD